jgi:hypothetical protein
MNEENNFIYIGENMHILIIYLRKLAYFKCKGLFFNLQKISALAILGLPISSTPKNTSKIIFSYRSYNTVF